MPIPPYQTLMQPVLELAAKGEVAVSDCIGPIASRFNLSDNEQAARLHSGELILSNRIRWAKTYLVHAGLLRMTRYGYFMTTERGVSVLDRSPTRVDNTVLSEFPEFVEWRRRSQSRSEINQGVVQQADPESLTNSHRTHRGGFPGGSGATSRRSSRSRSLIVAKSFRASDCRPSCRDGLWRLQG
ncbi:MAG: hypothetical protein EXQ86_03395 [Rhodospirillales bacterium]|nr:hypothetical protein [Rhodospirillales bacterium]